MSLAQPISIGDPRSQELGKFCILILVAKMTAVFEDGQRTFGKAPVQALGIICCQERVIISPKHLNRHIKRFQVRVDGFQAFGIALEPLRNLTDPTRIGGDIIRYLLG